MKLKLAQILDLVPDLGGLISLAEEVSRMHVQPTADEMEAEEAQFGHLASVEEWGEWQEWWCNIHEMSTMLQTDDMQPLAQFLFEGCSFKRHLHEWVQHRVQEKQKQRERDGATDANLLDQERKRQRSTESAG